MDPIEWLFSSDPAIRWQAMRDLTDVAPAKIAAERAGIPLEGIGAKILASQGADGSWHRADEPDWLPTLFTMQLLRATGVDRTDPAVRSAVERLHNSFRWHQDFGAKPFFEGEVEPCINGGALALGAYFRRPSGDLARRLVNEQLDDGGWNCDAPKSTRSSFHTTICVLEGLLEYEHVVGSSPEIVAARKRGEEYFLRRALFRRASTGEIANPEFLQFAFPPRYHYDVLRALDYFRTASARNADVRDSGVATTVDPDPGLADALHLVESKRQADGRWLLDASYEDALAFPLDESVGEPSRWNTLRSMRVLRWAELRGLAAH